MGLRDIPRAAVGGYIKVVRWPVDRTVSLIGGKRTVDRADAAARGAAGAALGDEQLKNDARRRSLAADERERADTLRAAAQTQQEIADEQLAESKDAAAERRRGAAQTTAATKAKAEQDRAAKARRAKQAEQRRKRATEKATAAREERIEGKAKRDRLDALAVEEQALDAKEEARRRLRRGRSPRVRRRADEGAPEELELARIVDHPQPAVQMHDGKEAFDGARAAHDRDVEPLLARARVQAQDRLQPRRVQEGQVAQIHDHAPEAGLLAQPLELGVQLRHGRHVQLPGQRDGHGAAVPLGDDRELWRATHRR